MSSLNSRASSNRSSAGRPIIHPDDVIADTRLRSDIPYRPDSHSNSRRIGHRARGGAGAQPSALVTAQRPMTRPPGTLNYLTTDGLDGALQGIVSGQSPVPT